MNIALVLVIVLYIANIECSIMINQDEDEKIMEDLEDDNTSINHKLFLKEHNNIGKDKLIKKYGKYIKHKPRIAEELNPSNKKKHPIHMLNSPMENQIHNNRQKHNNSKTQTKTKSKYPNNSMTPISSSATKNYSKNNIQLLVKEDIQKSELEHQHHLIEMFNKLHKQLSNEYTKNVKKNEEGETKHNSYDSNNNKYNIYNNNNISNNENENVNMIIEGNKILYDNIAISNSDEKDDIVHKTSVNELENLDKQEQEQIKQLIKLNEEEDEYSIKQFKYDSQRHSKKEWPQKNTKLVATPVLEHNALNKAETTIDEEYAKESENETENIQKETGTNPSICSYCHNNGLCVFKPEPELFRCYCIYGYSGRVCELRATWTRDAWKKRHIHKRFFHG